MAGSDLDGRRIKPAISSPRTDRWRVVPDAAISKYTILSPSGNTGSAYMNVTTASSASISSLRPLLVALHDVGSDGISSPSLLAATRALIVDQDTSGRAVGDPVYLSSGGAVTFTEPTSSAVAGTFRYQRRVGTVLTVSASAGVWLFDGSGGINGPKHVNTATVLNGQSSVAVDCATALNGAVVIATLNEADGVVRVVSAVIAAGVLTITLSANTTDDRTVAYAIF